MRPRLKWPECFFLCPNSSNSSSNIVSLKTEYAEIVCIIERLKKEMSDLRDQMVMTVLGERFVLDIVVSGIAMVLTQGLVTKKGSDVSIICSTALLSR